MAMAHLLSAIIVPLFFLPTLSSSSSNPLHPIVLIPGFSASQVDARLTDDYRPTVPHCAQRKGKGWFTLLFNTTSLADDPQAAVPCLADQSSLLYDAAAGDYRNAAGVETRVPFFGSTLGLVGFRPLVERLEGIGYRDGETLFGAPYDFRYAPAPPPHATSVGNGYVRRLAALVEDASAANGGMPVIILSHSLGCTFAYYLLTYSPPSWRQRYVKHFIPLAGAWGGSMTAMLCYTSGYNLGIPSVSPLAMRGQWRSLQSPLVCIPAEKAFGETPLVVTRHRNYSAADAADFLRDIGIPGAVQPYTAFAKPLFPDLPAPGVPVTHIHGTGVPTPAQLLFTEAGGFDAPPDVIYGDGDGQVNAVSLSAIEGAWGDVPGQFLKVVKVPNASHTTIYSADFALEHIVREITEANLYPLYSL